MVQVPTAAYIEVSVDNFDDWKIPDDYRRAIESHTEILEILLLPWPVEAIPHTGDNIWLGGVSNFDDLVVAERIYSYTKGTGLRVYVKAARTKLHAGEHKVLDIQDLLHAAQEGFAFDTRRLITEVLDVACLPSTVDGYIAQRGQDALFNF